MNTMNVAPKTSAMNPETLGASFRSQMATAPKTTISANGRMLCTILHSAHLEYCTFGACANTTAPTTVGGAGNDLLGHASPSQLKQQQGMVGRDSHHRNGPSGHLRRPRRRTFGSLARINRELIGKAVALDSPQRVVLYMDSTEIPVHGHQEPGPGRGEFQVWFGRNLSSSKQLCRRRGPAGI